MTDAIDNPPEMPTCFDEQGRRIAVTHPVYEPTPADDDRAAAVDYAALLGLLTSGATTAEQIGRRVALVAFIMQPPDRRGTLTDLGRLLGVSKQRAHAMLTRFRQELPQIAIESGFSR